MIAVRKIIATMVCPKCSNKAFIDINSPEPKWGFWSLTRLDGNGWHFVCNHCNLDIKGKLSILEIAVFWIITFGYLPIVLFFLLAFLCEYITSTLIIVSYIIFGVVLIFINYYVASKLFLKYCALRYLKKTAHF